MTRCAQWKRPFNSRLRCACTWISATALAYSISVSTAIAASTADKAAPPNIVLIVADDLGYGELGCYGQKFIKTPNIDRLASEGLSFTQFYSGSPVCAPSRCTLMTGKHTGHAAIRDNGDPRNLQHLKEKYGWEFPGQNPLPAEETTLAELLKQRGYATAAIGKWGLGHFGTTGDPNHQGFDLFFGFNCQRHAHNHYPRFLWRNSAKVGLVGNDATHTGQTFSQDLFCKEALEFIRLHQDAPFLLYLPFTIPHLSIQVPEESLAEYRDVIPEAEYRHNAYLKHPFPRAGYAAMVSHMDRDVGKIAALIDELGLGPNTIILFTSDNGPTYDRLGGSDSEFFESAAGLRGFKGSVYEGGIRVPLIARWIDKIEPGRSSDVMGAFWDMLPTLCDVAGAEIPADVDGVSLLPTLASNGVQILHDYLLWEFPSYGGQQAIRMGDWKGVRQNTWKGNRTWELYDLHTDRSERRDVAAEHPEVMQRLTEKFEASRVDSEEFPIFQPRRPSGPRPGARDPKGS